MNDRETFVSCNVRTISAIQRQIIEIKNFLAQYRWVMDAYVSDFFVHDFWSRLPARWTQYLVGLSPPEISFLLRNDTQMHRSIPPLSLLCYRKCVLSLSIRRHPVDLDDEQQVQKILSSLKVVTDSHQTNKYSPLQRTAEQSDEDKLSCVPGGHLAERSEWRGVMKNGQWMVLEHVYRKHVKPKKQHEIQKLSQAISYLCCHSQSCQVVDVGAGLGHLSRLLTFGHGVKVTTVEASEGHAPKATKYDREIKKNIKKAKRKKQKLEGPDAVDVITVSPVDLPSHISCMIHPKISTSNFLHLIQQSRRQQEEVTEEPKITEHGDRLVKTELSTDRDMLISMKDGHNILNTEVTNQTDIPSKMLHPKLIKCEKCQNQQTFFATDIFEITQQNMLQCDCNYSDCGNQTNTQIVDRSQTDNTVTHNAVSVESDDHFVLAGLHACGDLTATLVRMFVNCEAAVGLASVGCCYMKLSVEGCPESLDVREDRGYPMSQFISGLQDGSLTYSARELACHFADAYIQRLKDNPPHLKIHGYRAALQHLIVSLLPDYQHGSVKLTVKNATDQPFESYAKIALQKLGFTSEIPKELLKEAESYLPLWKDVVVFYTLRLCLAPVVETLLLLDRMMFLYEQGLSSVLVPIFDPHLSPRNFVLLAMKSS